MRAAGLGPGRRRVVFVAAGRLWLADLGEHTRWVSEVAPRPVAPADDGRAGAVVDARVTASGLLLAIDRGDRVEVATFGRGGLGRVATIARPAGAADDDPGVRFGFALPAATGWGPVAVRVDDGRWDVVGADLGVAAIAATTPVHGVAVLGGDPALVVEADDGRRLALQHRDRRALLPRAGGALVAVACAARLPLVAWATPAGDVVVYSLAHAAAVVLRAAEEPA
ncbi:MAG: hypothetical protein H6708_31355 [Kofleriaceae bacterium]|nr:hypothetical protein [Kofleriaceae bacterium]